MKQSLFFLFLLATAVDAALTVDSVFAPHMVLQRGAVIPVCGGTDSAEPVTVSFAGQSVQAKPKNGRWEARLAPMEACTEGRTLTITQGADRLELPDIPVGEVWVASGQSNMLWRLNRTGDTAALNATEVSPHFRFFHSEPAVDPAGGRFSPELCARLERGEMYTGTWTQDTPQSRARMSAVAYYFGSRLQNYLGVPVGVIHCSVGGSEMLAWLPRNTPLPAAFRTKRWQDNEAMGPWVKEQIHTNIGDAPSPHPYLPHYLFENGLRRWTRFPVAGFIWYQGEADSDIDDNVQNDFMLRTLIGSWRTAFGRENAPFLMVQLPRINNAPRWPLWPQYRQVQQDVALTLDGVECCVTIDLGTENRDVHPPKKEEVGRRLAALAANRVYGKAAIPAEGPAVKRHTKTRAVLLKRQGKELCVSFEHAEGLHTTDGQPPACFELSSDGKTFVPAEARVEKNRVILRAEGVNAPKHVRYAWQTFVRPNLVNKAGLPAAPFNSTWKTAE